MKKYVLLLIITLFLVACGNNDETLNSERSVEEPTDDEIETLFDKDVNLTLAENEELKIDLQQVSHGRSDVTDFVALKVKIENKQNKTFEFYIEDFKVDGKEIDYTKSWTSESEIKPNEIIETFINGYDYDELSINEHIAGRIIYRDYDSNRYVIEFSGYINE